MIISSLKKGFALTNKSLGLALFLALVGFIWNLVSLQYGPKPGATPANEPISPIFMGAGILFLFTGFFIQGGQLGYLNEKLKQGQSSVNTFLKSASKFFLRFMLLGVSLGIFGLIFLFLGLLATAAFKTVGVVIAVALAATWIYVVLLLFLSPYVVVVHDKGFITAIKESFRMSKKYNNWSLMGLLGLLLVIGFVIGILLGLTAGGINLLLKGTGSSIVIAVIGSLINGYLGVLVTASFLSFFLTVTDKIQTHSPTD